MYTLWLFNVAMENPPLSTGNSHHSNKKRMAHGVHGFHNIVKRLEGSYMYYV